jgi:hypothetical protein
MGAHREHFKGKIRVKVNSSSKRLLDLSVIPDGQIASSPPETNKIQVFAKVD